MLELRGVSARYGRGDRGADRDVVTDIGMHCSPGDLICVQGRSGAGKTTLLNIAAGLHRPNRGTVAWQDESIWEHSESWRRSERRRLIGYVMQGGGLVDSLTARENVALAAIGSSVSSPRERAESLLERFGIGRLVSRFPSELSGGEQQRVALCRALFTDPAILLIDEPTASLDRATADDVIGSIAALAAEGRAIIVASHDANVIARAERHLMLA